MALAIRHLRSTQTSALLPLVPVLPKMSFLSCFAIDETLTEWQIEDGVARVHCAWLQPANYTAERNENIEMRRILDGLEREFAAVEAAIPT